MSINKNALSIRKRPASDSIIPVNGQKILSFQHQASGGETSIDLSALVVPPSLSGFSNPALSDLLGAHLSVYPSSMQLVSSLNGILQKDVTWQMSGPQTITLNSYTLTAGEIITGIIHVTAANGVLVTDAYAVVATGTLTTGQDTIVTAPFTVNKYPTQQVGDVFVFLNGALQMRNVSNATAAPSADGNYQELPVAGGLTNQIKLNSPVGSDTVYVVVSNGLVAERPTGSMLAAVEVVQGKIDQLIPAVEALLGTPGVFGSSPSSVDLQSFGNAVLALQSLTADLSSGWSSYTPVITQDGTPCSVFVRNSVIRYKKIGKTVFLQGFVVYGESGSGSGGTFVKMTLPINGKAATNQIGIGSINKTSTAGAAMAYGTGMISSSEVDKIILVKAQAGNWIAGDASPGFGFTHVVSGSYEVD